MKLVLLAAGKSSRIYKDIGFNKCLIKIKGKTLIQHIIDNAISNGIKDIVVVVGFNPKKIIENLKNYKNIKFVYNKKFGSTDMVYSAFLAIKNIKSDVLISYTDIYYDKSLFSSLKKIDYRNITIPYIEDWIKVWKLRKKNIIGDAETFYKNKNNFLIEIGRKLTKKNFKSVKGQFMGIIFLPKNSIQNLRNHYLYKNKKKKIQFTEFINNLIKSNFKIKCKKYTKFWYEIDDKKDYQNILSRI